MGRFSEVQPAAAPSRSKAADRALSSEFACSEEEVRFVRTFVAMGHDEALAGECYRRSFCRQAADAGWVAAPMTIPLEALDDLEAWPRLDEKALQRRGVALLKVGHVRGYFEELLLPNADAARVDLRRQLLVGDESDRAAASKRILAEEDKQRFMDDVERYKQIMRDTGVPLVMPLPGHVAGHVRCPHCGEGHRVELQIDLEASFASMFPARPSADVPAESEPE